MPEIEKVKELPFQIEKVTELPFKVEKVSSLPGEEPKWGETLWGNLKGGIYNLASSVGSAVRWGSEVISGSEFGDPMLAGGLEAATEEGRVDPENDPVAQAGRIASKFWSDKAQEVTPHFEGTFMENPSWKRTAGIVVNAASSLATAIVATVASGGSTIAGAGALSVLEGSSQFEESREAGSELGEATMHGSASVVSTFLLEKFGLDRVLKGGGTNLLKRFFKSGTAEGTTESLQTFMQNMIAKYGYDDTRQYWDGIVESFIGGAGGGGIVSVFTNTGEAGKKIDEADQREMIEAASQVVGDEVANLVADTPVLEKVTEAPTEEAPDFTKLTDDEIESELIRIKRKAAEREPTAEENLRFNDLVEEQTRRAQVAELEAAQPEAEPIVEPEPAVVEEPAVEKVKELPPERASVTETEIGKFTPVDVEHAQERIDFLKEESERRGREAEPLKYDIAQTSKGENLIQFIKSTGGWLSPALDKGGNPTRDPNKRLGNRGEYDYWKTVRHSPLEQSRRVGRFLHGGTVPIDVWFNQYSEELAGMGINDLTELHDRLDQYSRDYEKGSVKKATQQAESMTEDAAAFDNEIQQLENYIAKQEGTDFDPTEFGDTTFDTVEGELGKQVDRVVGETVPPGGLSVQRVEEGIEPTTGQRRMDAPPEIEARIRASRGKNLNAESEGWRKRILSFFIKFTRPFEKLKAGAQFAQIKQYLARYPKFRSISLDRTLRSIQGVIAGLNSEQYELLERKIIYDDLMWEAEQGRELPYGFTPEVLQQEHSKITTMVATDPKVQKALVRRTKMMDNLRAAYQNTMKKIGLDPQFDNPYYFRHQVLNYANLMSPLRTAKGIAVPKRGWHKKRKGSSYDINSAYVEAESEVMAQMLLDMEVAKMISHVMTTHDISEQLKQVAEEETGSRKNWQDFLPEGYKLWQPEKGNAFFLADSIPSRIADELLSERLESYGLTKEELGQVLAVGGRKMELAIPAELAETLDKPFPDKVDNVLIQMFVRKPILMWKQWTLLQPLRVAKYNLRNLTGDLEAVFLGNFKTLTKVPRAAKDLYRVFYADGAMSDSLRNWFQRGGFESTLQVQEIDSAGLKHLRHFSEVLPADPVTTENVLKKTVDAAKWPFLKVWKYTRMATDFRESLLRYAAYLDYYEQITRTGQRNYGASIKEEVDAIQDPHDKAFKLSNDLLGAYDEISVLGRTLRENLIPFWSFQEINARRYWRFFKNAVNDPQVTSTVGRRAALTMAGVTHVSAGMAIRIGKFVLAISAMDIATQLWNNFIFPEEEDDLPESVQSKSHIIFGRTDEGEVIYFSRLGLLADLLEWVGLEDYRLTVRELLNQKTTHQEVIKDMATSALEKAIQGAMPMKKIGIELLTRRAFFPSVFEPRTIRDRWLHAFKSFGVGGPYSWLAGLPMENRDDFIKAFADGMAGLLTYSVNPGSSAYGNIIDKKNRFMKKVLLREGDGFHVSPKGNALHNYKLAVKLEDMEAAKRFAKEYIILSGKQKAASGKPFSLKMADKLMQDSVKRADPLYGLNDFEKLRFLKSLNQKEREDLEKALIYYYTVIAGKKLGGK
jgi:hypothetical protein